MSIRHLVIIAFFVPGASIALFAIIRYLRETFRQASTPTLTTGLSRGPTDANFIYYAILLLIVCLGFIIRIEGLDLRGISHVEVYVPGINLPKWISEPPPRLDFLSTLYWHWHDEPHPQAYYLLMFFWTKLFGTSLFSLRFPSVIFGTGAIILIYVLASMAYGRKIGLISAALLAFNGHHIYWSQNARMYAMVCFLGLASAVLLFSLLRQPRRRPFAETGYVAVTFLGVFTQLFFWPFLAAQMLCTLAYSKITKSRAPRILSLQALVAILGSPLWAHAVYRSRAIDLGNPTLAFIEDFLDFGFLFTPDYFTSMTPRDISPGLELVVTTIALLCLTAGLLNRQHRCDFQAPVESNKGWRQLIPISIGFSLIIIALSIYSWRRQIAMATTALVPLIAVFSLPVAHRHWPALATTIGSRWPFRTLKDNCVGFFLLLYIAPAAMLILISMVKTMMIPRGFLLFVPYLLVIAAAGMEKLSSRSFVALPLAILVSAIHLYSIDFQRKVPDPNDYRTLAHEMLERMEPDDLIFVYPRDWATTPLFYYFQGQENRLIAHDFVKAMESRPDARVWIPLFTDYKPPSEAMLDALKNHHVIDHVTAHMCEAYLYAPVKR